MWLKFQPFGEVDITLDLQLRLRLQELRSNLAGAEPRPFAHSGDQ